MAPVASAISFAAALRYLRDLVGIEKLLIGTDAPFPPGDPDPLASLRDAGFEAQDIDRIAEQNPRALFGDERFA